MTIWVICIAYDYGVWRDAGYFESEEAANAWIASAHEREKARYEEFLIDDPEYAALWGDEGPCYTEYYAASLKPNSQ